MTKATALTVLALLSSTDGFTMTPMVNRISARSTHTSVLKMSAAEDEVSKFRAAAAKMREEAQALEKVREMSTGRNVMR